jgi:hypothetical protein
LDAAAAAITRSSAVGSGGAGGAAVGAAVGAAAAAGAGCAAADAGVPVAARAAGGGAGVCGLRMSQYAPARTARHATPTTAVLTGLDSDGGLGAGRTTVGVNGTPSTAFPQRHVVAGGVTLRPHAGQTRLMPWGAAIYEKILT